MRVMLDTNLLVSAIIFNSKPIWEIINRLAENHSIVLCSYTINELHDVIKRKFPDKTADTEQFLHELPFEYVYTPKKLPKDFTYTIRDPDDTNILYSAILSDVDILISGDKDFDDVEMERPIILKPAEFLFKY